MSRYVDGFVIPLARDRLEEYRVIAQKASVIWKEHGALDYWECIGDDLDSPGVRSFRELAACSEDETVVFAWVVYPSRAARDAANAAIFADPRVAAMMDPARPIFDCARMGYGGFRSLLHPDEDAGDRGQI